MFDPAIPGVAVVDQQMAAIEHLAPGDTVRVTGVPNDQKTGRPDFSKASALTFRVTGVVMFDSQVVTTAANSALPTVLASTPFSATPLAGQLSYGDEAAVRLRPGASLSQFVAGANALAARYRATGGQVDSVSLADQVSATERAIRPQATALAIFAALTGLVALAVIGQLLARQLALDSAEFPVLRAIGLTRPPLVTLSLARVAVVTVGGAVLAVAVAVAASPLMPIGPARRAASRRLRRPAGPRPGLAIVALVPLAVRRAPRGGRRATPRGPQGDRAGVRPDARPARSAPRGRVGSASGRSGSGWHWSQVTVGPRCRCAPRWPGRPSRSGPWSPPWSSAPA